MGRLTFFLLLVAIASCVQSPLVPCGDIACPPGDVCTAGGCAAPSDVDACQGLSDGDACRASNGGAGTCQGGACHTGLCGNGNVDVGEACDDGNQISGDGCRDDCGKVEMCGDGEVDVGEACDDGNTNVADGCDACKRTQWNAASIVGTAVNATTIALANPGAVAVDGRGRIYIADTNNHRVRRIEEDGSLTTLAGTGNAGYSGDGGAATSAELNSPGGIAVDGIGRVFVSDTTNQRVRLIDSTGTITTIAGTGIAGYSGAGGAASLAELASPNGVVVDGLGRIFVADTDNHIIRRIDIDGTITTVAGTPQLNGFSGDNGAARSAKLDSPHGVAVDSSGRLIIADSLNSRVRRVELDDTIVTVAGTGGFGYNADGIQATTAQLAGPVGVAVDPQDRIVVADALNQRVRRIATDGIISTIAGTGNAGYGGDGAAATAADLSLPVSVAVDAEGRVSIADNSNQRIRRITADGIISTVGGTGTFGFGGDASEANSALLSSPYSVLTDATGRIYVTDTFHNCIRRVETDGTISIVAGTGIAGDTGNGGPALAAQLSGPNGIALDAQGRLVITDTFNNKIKRIDAAGIITVIAGTGAPGSTGDNGPATSAKLDHPNDIAIDSQGRILIADTYNSKIRRIEANGNIVTVAGTGSPGYDGDNVQATATRINFPYNVGVDSTDRILLPDTANHRLRRIDTNGVITTIAGTGVSGYNGAGLQATASQLSGPQAAREDSMHRIVFTDPGNHLIRRIELNGTLTTIAGSPGNPGARGDGGAPASAFLTNPHGLTMDSADRIFFTDTNNNRVRKIVGSLITTVAGRVDPENVGPVAKARLEDPQAIAVTPAGTFIAAGSSGTLEAILGGRVRVVAGGYPEEAATGTLARYRTADFGSVGGTAVDTGTGLIYITETSSNRLHVITQVDPADPATWTIAPLANTAGSAGFADGAAATARFRSPTGLYLDAGTHKLYIADTGNHAIRVLDLTTSTVTTLANSNHALGFGGDGGPASAARLYRPTAITRCADGDLFIADSGNNRVRRIVPATSTITTVLGDGVPASSGEGSPARTFPVDGPRGLACDASGNLFVTSTTTVRLVTADAMGIVDGSGPVQTIYGEPPRDVFPSSITSCLTALAVTGPTTVQVSDGCTGLLVELSRSQVP